MFKYIDQQLAGNNTVHIDTGSLVITQRYLLFDNDQGTGLDLAHLHTGFGDLVDRLLREFFIHAVAVVKRQHRADNVFLAQLFQCLPQLRLQHHDQCRHRKPQHILRHPQYRCHPEKISQQQKNKDDNQTLKQYPCPGRLHPYQCIIQ